METGKRLRDSAEGECFKKVGMGLWECEAIDVILNDTVLTKNLRLLCNGSGSKRLA